jgi:hypothetical protein
MVKMTKKTKTRKNKKKIKTQTGGLPENMNTNMNMNNQIINDKPTIKDNLKKFANIWLQSFNYMGLYALDKVENKLEETSKSFGVNPNDSLENQISKIGKNAERFNKVLDTPEGKRALSNLNALFDKITKKVIIPSSQKLADGLIENLQPIMIKGQNAVFALLSASPFGAVIDIPRFLSESLGVVEKSVSLADDVLDISQDAVNGIKNEKSNYDKVVSEFNSLLDNANIKLSSGLNNIESTVNNYGKKIVGNEKMPLTPIQNGGKLNDSKLLKNYQKQSKMIGGRIIQSQLEFLRPRVNSYQILKQSGGKWNATRRTYKRRNR